MNAEPIANNNDEDDDDSDEDEIFVTPSATPPNELDMESFINNNFTSNDQTITSTTTTTSPPPSAAAALFSSSSNSSSSNTLMQQQQQQRKHQPLLHAAQHSIFDLKLNALQVMCGRIFSDNLQFYARKGHSRCHILDKFDIHVDIKLKKEDAAATAAAASKLHDEDTALSVELAVNLMKLNVDDLKLINAYRAFQTVHKLLDAHDDRGRDRGRGRDDDERYESRPNTATDDDDEAVLAAEAEMLNSSSSSAPPPPPLSTSSNLFKLTVRLNELDMAISIVNTSDAPTDDDTKSNNNNNNNNNSGSMDVNDIDSWLDTSHAYDTTSLCELKIYSINSTLAIGRAQRDIHLNLCIFNILLIDAIQIYGTWLYRIFTRWYLFKCSKLVNNYFVYS